MEYVTLRGDAEDIFIYLLAYLFILFLGTYIYWRVRHVSEACGIYVSGVFFGEM
jgi:hypothetical protein